MISRYLVFAGRTYYSASGWNTYNGSFDTLEAAKNRCRELLNPPADGDHVGEDWAQIVDGNTSKILLQDGLACGDDPPDEIYPEKL